jgi:DNA-directed RNA polymerase specialized sigma24 family protein
LNLDEAISCAPESPDDLLSLDEALTKLASEDPVKAQLVQLRYFAGLAVQEAADVLGISRATADRYWAYAKVWLYCQITSEEKPADL